MKQKAVIGIHKITKEIIHFNSIRGSKKEGFNESKVGESCRNLKNSHYGYFWYFKDEFNPDNLNLRIELSSKKGNHRKYNTEDIKEKICKKCNILKPINNFHKEKNGMAGKRNICNKCNTKRAIENRRKIEKTTQRKLSLNLRTRLVAAIKNNQKTGSSVKDLGCSIEELKIYLESKFQFGMNWKNYGRSGWHIDHIKPLNTFNLENREEFLKACHYTNLRPLWAKDNFKRPKNGEDC